MQKLLTLNINEILIIIIIILFIITYKSYLPITKSDIYDATDNWINAVTVNHDPDKIMKLFCKDGNLLGTVSQVKRKGKDIKLYFDYFAKLPNIKVISKRYDITKVTSNVFINTAFITWMWDGLEKPIIARMTFVFRDLCIYQLHSSALPTLNESLLKISKLE